jgi:amino acid transporter
MVNNKYLRIFFQALLMLAGVYILTNYNGSIVGLSVGGLLILIGLAWIVIGTANEGLKLYKEVVAPHDTKTRNGTAVLILISILLVYLLFRYFSVI